MHGRKMGTVSKLLLGIASFGAVATMCPLSVSAMLCIALEWNPGEDVAILAIVLAGLASFATVGAIAFFMHRVSNDSRLSAEQKVIWTMVLLTLWPFSAPVFWYVHIWKEDEDIENRVAP